MLLLILTTTLGQTQSGSCATGEGEHRNRLRRVHDCPAMGAGIRSTRRGRWGALSENGACRKQDHEGNEGDVLQDKVGESGSEEAIQGKNTTEIDIALRKCLLSGV